jgi:hypothetical protein
MKFTESNTASSSYQTFEEGVLFEVKLQDYILKNSHKFNNMELSRILTLQLLALTNLVPFDMAGLMEYENTKPKVFSKFSCLEALGGRAIA